MPIRHPIADEWTADYMTYVSTSPVVRLTHPLSEFLRSAILESRRPVLATYGRAALTGPVASLLRRAGGLWSFRDESGYVYNAAHGFQSLAFTDLWEEPDVSRARHPWFMTEGPATEGALLFDTMIHQRADDRTLVGRVAEKLLEGLGVPPPNLWDIYEPLTRDWDLNQITEFTKRALEVSTPVLFATGDQAIGEISITRTPHGMVEQTRGAVSTGQYPEDLAGVGDQAAKLLRDLAGSFQPNVGFVSMAEIDPGLRYSPGSKRPELPLAVLIGPRAVKLLEIDFKSLSEKFEIEMLGRRRVASLLVKFNAAPDERWHQAAELTVELGFEDLMKVMGLVKEP
ncbi:DUF6177 family protein [Nesterenkonia sedimenti]|nr:DUF6177 family protein [Nesterenkonia sedimenti]